MPSPTYDLSYLSDPRVFAVGRLPAHSDHEVYASEEEARTGATSLRQNLNGQWKFTYAARPAQRPEGFYAPDYDVSGWKEIAVPGHIELAGWGHPQYVNTQYPWYGREDLTPPQIPAENPVGSYVRFFELPADWQGLRVTLTFHGVETAFYCWVNGQFIGYAEDSFTPSHFDITSALKPGVNRLAVEVFRFSTASWLEDQDFWRFFGIFRDVELSVQPRAHVADVFVHADMDGSLCVEASLNLPEEPVELSMRLLDANGREVDSLTFPAQASLRLERRIEGVRLWSAETPNLYTLQLSLPGEVCRVRVGFRRFEIQNGLMCLNGKRIVFHGADRHEFCAEAGRCIRPEHMQSDIRTLKRNNINAVRTSHYPNQSAWYRLCDEYGIYLIDETNMETHGTWCVDRSKAIPDSRPEWLPAVLDRAQSMLERDKNHPSVLIWSCGNESCGGRDIFEMSQFFRRRDPSRVVHYEGVFNDRSYPDTTDVESQMYTPASRVEQFIHDHPEKPFILCEYTHSMGNSNGGMFKYLELERREQRYQGGFIWDFIDQALLTTAPNGKPRLAWGGDFGDRPCDRDFCGNGLLFADRTETPKMQEVKYLYQPIRLLPDKGGVTVENRCLFLNANAYELRWQLLRDGQCIQAGRLENPDVPAGETRRFALPVLAPTLPGEYALTCTLNLRAATDWAQAGYALMHGQSVIADIPAPAREPRAEYEVVRSNNNTGVADADFRALFSLGEGGLCSLDARDGLERIITAPTLSLYRAPTNNDIGNNDWRTEGLWLAASQLAKTTPVSFDRENGLLCARYRVQLPVANVEMAIAYTVLGQGRIEVVLSWPGQPNLPDFEAFGLSLRVPRELCHVRYYGLGPDENYVDRSHGALLGCHAYTARENVTPYLQPQECGNREGVRWLTLTDAQGRGLRVERVDTPLSVSVLPCSPWELMNARHQDELAEPTYTYLDVALCRKGVGGDDTWGAPVHPEFHLPASQPRTLRFELSVVK